MTADACMRALGSDIERIMGVFFLEVHFHWFIF